MLRERHLAPRRWLPRVKAPQVFRFARVLRLRQSDPRRPWRRCRPAAVISGDGAGSAIMRWWMRNWARCMSLPGLRSAPFSGPKLCAQSA